MKEVFILDSNFFIQAHRIYYPMDIVPGFWLKIRELAELGMIFSIDKVGGELYLNKDELTNWCKLNLPPNFFRDSSIAIENYIMVSSWAHSRSNHYNKAALNEFLDVNEADAWLIAYALNCGGKIVTHETSEPNRKSKVKIPDACQPFHIQCVDTIKMFRLLEEKFI